MTVPLNTKKLATMRIRIRAPGHLKGDILVDGLGYSCGNVPSADGLGVRWEDDPRDLFVLSVSDIAAVLRVLGWKVVPPKGLEETVKHQETAFNAKLEDIAARRKFERSR